MARVVEHARECEPSECCGFMMAEPDDGVTVTWVLPAENIEKETPEVRFVPGNREYLEAVELETAGKARIVGIYHSHPGGRPAPSEYDREMAVPGLIYLIVALAADKVEHKAWRMGDKDFGAEPLEVI